MCVCVNICLICARVDITSIHNLIDNLKPPSMQALRMTKAHVGCVGSSCRRRAASGGMETPDADRPFLVRVVSGRSTESLVSNKRQLVFTRN